MADSNPWVEIFCNPRFRKGWEDVRNKVSPNEQQCDDVVYIFGRLMGAETGWPLPRYSTVMTYEMIEAIKKCDAFMKQMETAQLLQSLASQCKEKNISLPFVGEALEQVRNSGDLSAFMQEVGTKQGDGNDPG